MSICDLRLCEEISRLHKCFGQSYTSLSKTVEPPENVNNEVYVSFTKQVEKLANSGINSGNLNAGSQVLETWKYFVLD